MTVFQAVRDGVRRVNSAPAILLVLWAMTTLVSVPLAIAMRGAIEQHLGASLEAEGAASGVNYDWMQEFSGQASGIATTFSPTVIGFGAVLDNLSAFVDKQSRPVLIVGAAGVYLAVWMLLAGGIIDRYARDRATRAEGFLWASGGYVVRFLRLGIVAALVYALLFGAVHPWLFDKVFPDVTRGLTAERAVFLVRLALYAVFISALAACNLVFDYAKVRAVVEDRRSMLGALRAAVVFLRRNWAAAIGVYVADAALFAGVLALYAVAAPGAGAQGWSMWLGFAMGQVYVVARIWVKLVFWASETALFQGRLAHAGYVAARRLAWPESPSAEALGELGAAGVTPLPRP